MEKLTLWVGSCTIAENGLQEGEIRPVKLVGEELASTTRTSEDGARSITETLYRTETGRLLVQVEDFSQAGVRQFSLHPVTPADMERDGRFAALGKGGWFWALFQTAAPPEGDSQPAPGPPG